MSDQQDLAALEKAYAENPSGDAFIPLSTAYLAQGRFMEAMVVCKKGIKSQPDNVAGRLLLARVYSEQGKVPKAIEEVKGLLETKKDVPEVHFFYGQMLDKSGKLEEAIESFKETLRKDRAHEGAAAALKAKGIDWSPGPSPEEIAAAEAAKQAAADAETARVAAEQAAAAAAAQAAAAAAAPKATSRPRAPGSQGISGAPTPRTTPQAQAQGQQFPANDPAFQGYAGAYGFVSGPVPVMGAGRRLGPGFTFGLGALLLVVIVVVVFVLSNRKKTQEEIAYHLKNAKTGVMADTTAGHKKVISECDAVLKLDDSQSLASAHRALSLSILAVERGDKELEAESKKATDRAAKVADGESATIAAEMIQLRAEKKSAEAIAIADKYRGSDDILTKSPWVKVEYGRALADLGRVDEMVKLAEGMKDASDPMALNYVGETYRRVGDKIRARNAFDAVMKNNLDHDPARAARALLILENDDITNLGIALDDMRTLKDLGKESVGTKQRGYASLGLAIAGARIGRPERDNETEMQNARSLLRTDPELPLFDAKKALAANDFKKAQELAQGAIGLDKVRLEPYLTLIDAAVRAKDFAAADKGLADAAAVFGDNLDLGIAKAGRLRDQDRADEAVQALQGLLAKHDVAEVHMEIGKVLMKKGDVPGAVAALKKAGEKASARAPAVQARVYMWLGRALAKAEDHEQAVQAFGQGLSATSEFSPTYFFLGQSLVKLGKKDAAKEAFAKYLRAEPGGNYAEATKQALGEL